MARPICIDPTCVGELLAGRIDALEVWEERLRRDTGLFGNNSPIALLRTVNSFAGIYWFYAQLYRLGRGEPPALRMKPLMAMLEVMGVEKRLFAQRKRLGAEMPEAYGPLIPMRLARS